MINEATFPVFWDDSDKAYSVLIWWAAHIGQNHSTKKKCFNIWKKNWSEEVILGDLKLKIQKLRKIIRWQWNRK